MLMVTGTSGEFMSILPKTVIVCLLGSLIEAMVILPAHYVEFGARKRAVAAESGDGTSRSSIGFAPVGRGIDRLRAAFLRAQDAVLDHRYVFLALSAAALYFAIGLARHIPVDLFPSDYDQIMITVEAPTDFGIDQTNEVVLGIERALGPVRHELTDVSTWVGMAVNPEDQRPLFGVNYGILYTSFPNTPDNVANPARVLHLIRDVLAAHHAKHPEEIKNLRVVPPRNGPLIGKPIAIRILSDDYDEAKEIANEMKAELVTIPGVFNIEDNVPLGPRELQVSLNEHRASIHGLTFDQLGAALMAANEGLVPSSFKDPQSDEDVDIRVLLADDQRSSVVDLLDTELRTPAGYLVKLGDVADIELQRGYQRLYHNDAQRAVIVYADVDNLQATSISVNETMKLRFRDVPERHPGVTLLFGGEFQATDNAFADMRRAFGLAILAIYGILAAQFRSYSMPLIVMSVIVFSFVGVALGMFAMGYPLSMYVVYAVVGLAGVVVNGSLVLIDFTSRERERGASPRAALRTASHQRFRPILLTTVTTIAGLLPMALGLSGYSRQFGPFATAIVSGLAAASLITLFVVPAAYLALEDLKHRLRSRSGFRTAKTLESA
jgi:HAE1 family hydrophobic/amphiphilic exporter-1